jgi:hypothetical protein
MLLPDVGLKEHFDLVEVPLLSSLMAPPEPLFVSQQWKATIMLVLERVE